MSNKIAIIGTSEDVIVMRALREAKSAGIDVILINPGQTVAELMFQYPDRQIINIVDEEYIPTDVEYKPLLESFKLINPIRDSPIRSGQENRRNRRRRERLNNRKNNK
jgi:hypothetical protein